MDAANSKTARFETLKCPECGAGIPVTDAISAEINERASHQTKAWQAQHTQVIEKAERELVERRAALDDEVNDKLQAALLQRTQEVEERARTSVRLQLSDFE